MGHYWLINSPGFGELRDPGMLSGPVRSNMPSMRRPLSVTLNVESVDRIIYAIFSRFNEDWKNHTLELFTQAA